MNFLKILHLLVCQRCTLSHRFKSLTEAIDLDEYLPPETLSWCQSTLAGLGYPSELTGSEFVENKGERCHLQAYMDLRRAGRAHIDSRAEPRLKLCEGYRLEGNSKARAILNDVVVRRLQEAGGDTLHALADSFIDGETLLTQYGEEGLIVDADFED
jgi:hypothetical protein